MIRATLAGDIATRARFRELTRRAQRDTVRAELTAMGREWEDEARRLTQEAYPRRDGPGHKPNTTHAENAFQHRIIEGSDDGFPMTLELTTKPGVNARKTAALEYGQKAHRITAVNASTLRYGVAVGDIYTPNQKSVMWKPGPKSTPDSTAAPMRTARATVLARRRR